jgi:hypothetical protein
MQKVLDSGEHRPTHLRGWKPEHDPEKCVAVFGKDHAQSKSYSAVTTPIEIIAL